MSQRYAPQTGYGKGYGGAQARQGGGKPSAPQGAAHGRPVPSSATQATSAQRPTPTARPAGAVPRPAPAGRPGAFTAPAQKQISATPPQPPAGASSTSGVVLTVSTQSKKDDEIGIQTLLGDYKEKGTNHGRKVYLKLQKIVGHEEISVYMYYWDKRDGEEFSGWWFGDKIGGTQVWAKCPSHTPTPPRVGWRIPWDSPNAEPGLLLVNACGQGGGKVANAVPGAAIGKVAGKGGAGSSSPAPPGAVNGKPWEDKARRLTEQVTSAESAANAVLSQAKSLSNQGQASTESIKAVMDKLQGQQTRLGELVKTVTQELSSSRSAGASAASSATALAKLSPRLRAVQANVASEVNKLKVQASKSKGNAELRKQEEEKVKAQELKDSSDFKQALPAITDAVSTSEDAVESVSIIAQPLIADPPEGDTMKAAMEEIELSANEAQTKIAEARRELNLQLTDARKYAPDIRKKALAAYQDLQNKLSQSQTKLNPFKKFRQEFQHRVAAKKAVAEITDQLGDAELEIEKASMMTMATGQMPEEEVATCEETAGTAQQGLTTALRLISQRLASADGALKEELTQMKKRTSQSKTKLDEVLSTLRKQREGLSTQQTLGIAHEKADRAEELMSRCQDAEMPFLTGLEVLPAGESDKAVAACEAAAVQAEQALKAAKSFIQQKIAAAKQYSKEVAKNITEELMDVQKRCDEMGQKMAAFKKETSTRKMSSMMMEVVAAVAVAEEKKNNLNEAAAIFSTESLDEVTPEGLKEANESTTALGKEVQDAVAEARKVLAAKQRDNRGPEFAAALQQHQSRLGAVQQDLAKVRKAAQSCDRLVKAKQALVEEEKRVSEAEEAVTKMEAKAKPADGETLADEAITEINKVVDETQKMLRTSQKAVDSHLNGAVPAVRTALQKVTEQCKKIQARIDVVKASTKEQREKVLASLFVSEGAAKVAELDALFDKVTAAELPFLKGIEVLPSEESRKGITDSEAAASAVQKAISEARSHIAAKNIELKTFKKELQENSSKEFAKLTEKVNAAAGKLSDFRKETEGRKRTAQMQEAAEKVTAVEAEVKKANEAVVPIGDDTQEDANVTAEDASAKCAKFTELMKVVSDKMSEARAFVSGRQRDGKATPEQKTALAALQKRLSDGQVGLSKAKKIAGEHEQKFVAKKLVAEAAKMVESVEGEVKAATEACVPLLQEAGERFLVQASVQQLAQGLRECMAAKGSTVEDLFKKASAKKDKASQEAFTAWLAKLPESTGNDSLTFGEERRAAIFKSLDAAKGGHATLGDFKSMFNRRFVCVKPISVTDGFAIADSKTVCKMEAGEVVEGIGDFKKEEKTGMTRLEVKLLSAEGKAGWVTTEGNQGTKYFEASSPFKDFNVALDKKIAEHVKAVAKVVGILKSKQAELQSCTSGPLSDAKTELTKVRPQVLAATTSMDDLRKKVASAKQDCAKKVEAEKNAHIEARERKEADAILSIACVKVEAMDGKAKKLEEASDKLVKLAAPELDKFASPVTIQQECEKLAGEVVSLAEDARTTIKDQQEKTKTALKGPLAEAKRELGKMRASTDAAERSGKKAVAAVKTACETIADARFVDASAAFRAELQRKSLTADALFAELVKAGDEGIGEAAFCGRLAQLEGLSIQAEHAKLLCQLLQAGSGSIARRRFCGFIQQYFVVIKAIALTTDFEISKCKTVRKAELDEIVEVLEGPKTDDKLGLVRVRGRSLADGTQGWISVRGNQGTPFLQEVEKPFYSCNKQVDLETDFAGSATVRPLKADEVLELMEGPRTETYPEGIRARGKASKDGVLGWFTVKDRKGAVFAELSDKYYTCSSSVAMTDEFDIKNCKVLRKLAVNEVFIAEGAPTVEGSADITRVKGRAVKDDVVGWITTKGNAGTVYATPSTKHYTVTREVPLLQSKGAAEALRHLAAGEAVEVAETQVERFEPAVRVKGRVLGDGAVGWLTLKSDTVKPWVPIYTALSATPLHETLAIADSKTVREIAAGEKLELLEGPTAPADGGAKLLRMRGRAEKDGAVGWVTIRKEDGKPVLRC